jgi:hypothetical protein
MRTTTLFQRFIRFFGITALTVLFVTCQDGLQVQEQKDKATVSFYVTDSIERSVLPQVLLADVASYKLLGGRNGDTETELVEFFTGIGTSVSLDPGTWNFTLNAYNNSYEHILQGKVQNKQITLTGTNQVSFSLSVLNSGIGSIQITLNFPVDAGITQIKTNGDIVSEEFNGINNGNFVYTKNGIATGDYLINFELYRGEVLRTVVSELVMVRSNLTSSKTITLVGDNLKLMPTYGIEVDDLTGIDEWELTEQIVLATPHEDKLFTVTGTYAAYRWYLDGMPVGTSLSYILNKPSDVYQLVVTVTNSNGESRSGRCRITVAPQLPVNVLANGDITEANGEDWYSIPVTNGTTYYIWWNDSFDGDGTKSGNVGINARYENETTYIFSSAFEGWTTGQSFTANQTGTVYIRVRPVYSETFYMGTVTYSTGNGTYGIGYCTSSNTKPAVLLTANVWADGNITYRNGEDRYSFPVTNGTTYHIWWNDSRQGNNTKTGDVLVRAQYENQTTFIFNNTDSGWTTAQSFTANQTGTVYIMVKPYANWYTGTYGIVYSTGSIRP